MKIYTKTGDKGTTSLIGGKRVAKFHPRIEAYGTVDELISLIGLVRDQDIALEHRNLLTRIQDRLMVCASHLAVDSSVAPQKPLPCLLETDISVLEEMIDLMEGSLPALSSFILPGGSASSSCCHVARSVCRRAERAVVHLSQSEEVPEIIIRYLNRLADFLFVLSRRLLIDSGGKDILWKTDL
jgi:cob(I)alamin adenosyltransferase